MTEQETIEHIQRLYDAYIRSSCKKEVVIEHLAFEFGASMVAKALRGYIVKTKAA